MVRMNAPITLQVLLHQITQLQHLERGKLCIIRQGLNGPYYNHQTWEKGKNVSRYVPQDQVPALREAIAGYRQFQTLVEQYVQLMVQQSRAERTAGFKKRPQPPGPPGAGPRDPTTDASLWKPGAQRPGRPAIGGNGPMAIAMKNCGYCGKENSAEAVSCFVCGTESHEVRMSEEESPPALPAPKFVPAETVSQTLVVEQGFHRADWAKVHSWIETHVEPLERGEAGSEAAMHWVCHLRDDLGAGYYVLQSKTTILLADLPMATGRWLLNYAGQAAVTIRRQLREVAWGGASGKDVVLVFREDDDYYQYLAYHSKDGVQPQSGGVCIHTGYTHIAIPWREELDAANAVVHELTHDCLAHLALPLWLNEGVAVSLQKAIAPPTKSIGQSDQDALFGAAIDWRPPIMWDELAERHFAFWTEENIQDFWAGTSFHEPGDSNELSYSLAEVFVKLLSERGVGFHPFLQQARPEDGGQSAALQVLDADLGEIAGTFLGKGNWRPRRPAISECWKGAGWTTPKNEQAEPCQHITPSWKTRSSLA